MSQGIHFVCQQMSQGLMSQGIHFVSLQKSQGSLSQGIPFVCQEMSQGLLSQGTGFLCQQRSQGINVKSLKDFIFSQWMRLLKKSNWFEWFFLVSTYK